MGRPPFVGALASVAAVVLAACGGTGTGPAGGPGNGSGGGTVVDASTRMGWDQPADSLAELATFHFAIYANGNRQELPQASCSPPAGGAGFPCAAQLPSLPPGQHLIEIACYVTVGGVVFESPRSAPLVVTVNGPVLGEVVSSSTATTDSAASDSPAAASGDLTTRDGVRLHVDVLAAIDRPTAWAASSGGDLFVGGAAGRITVIRDGLVEGQSVIDVDADAGPANPVLGLALDPEFDRNHFVYTVDVAPGNQPAFRLARFREAGGRLGERVILLDGVPASSAAAAASVAFGPDARLYVGFDDGGNPDSARRAASYNGKVLRLNGDGTTPADQPAATPVFASNVQSPRSIEWDAESSSLWVADLQQVERFRPTARRGLVRSAYRLPHASGAASLAIYRAPLIPGLQGSLLVAPAADSADLLRLQLGDGDESTITGAERLALPGGPTARRVHAGADGAIYVGTDREVLRIVPGR
jgi:glucose/arabinose dehydrogenase